MTKKSKSKKVQSLPDEIQSDEIKGSVIKPKESKPETAVTTASQIHENPVPESTEKIEQKPPKTTEKIIKNIPDKNSNLKNIALVILGLVVIFIAYYFITLPDPSKSFVPKFSVSPATFSAILQESKSVFIVMDIRTNNSAQSDNVMRCGVDFAGSNGLADKNLTFLSIGDDTCLLADASGNVGERNLSECFLMMQDKMTVYVKPGQDGAKYYSNGMVVTIGPVYTVGTCGIRYA